MEPLEALKSFIRPHPLLNPEAGDIFTPQGHNRIRFFFMGGFVVEGQAPELEINFNSDNLLILATGDSVYRFLRTALIGFELVRDEVYLPVRAKAKRLH
ncbi:MAG: hypothetical protein ABWY06_03235 [Pseudomonas sp.]|uniref:hypothetical protein n=1 Tax=Pseudomonas sp. TaxID=306 RepID=UPI003395053F